ncbi:MAG TPA: hypothetical protein VJT75_13655 [Thermoleophilaceae bacterium]|nr:hypothetical protein [Thermoleophilaceae bacterium]
MAIVAVIGLNADPRDADSKDTYALIFGVLAVFLVLLFTLQLSDLRRAEGADADAVERRAEDLDNPATVDEPTLWAAMAVRPIDSAAVRARRQVWATTRSSIRTGMVITALIFLAVPPIYLFDTFVPLMIGGSLIVLIAVWKSLRLLGGGVDRLYEDAGRAMAPLGLDVIEHPDLTIEPKGVAPYRMGPAMRGTLRLAGVRHGRPVGVAVPAGGGVRTESAVLVSIPAPEFAFRARDGRLKAEPGAPDALAELLRSIPNSPRWNGVRGRGAPGEGLVVERKSARGADWLLDLWLAERLAERCEPIVRG